MTSRNHKLALFWISTLVGSLALAACGGGNAPAIAPAPVAPNSPAPNATASVVAAAPSPSPSPTPDDSEEYAYNPIGKRDPFESFLAEDNAIGSQKTLTPLQRYDIDQMNLIGIIWGISTPRAMVVTPDGKGYVVQKGTLVGKNWGKVSRITQDEVIISEEYRDFEGKLIVHEMPLKLPKDQGEDELE